MTFSKIITASLLTFSLGAGAALAKGHDQGVNDGDIVPGTQTGARTVIDALTEAGVLDGKGVSAAVNKGKQGAAKSGK